MVPKNPRVNVFLSQEDYEFIKKRSEQERRSMGNLASYIVQKWIAEERIKEKQQENKGKE